MAGMMKASPGTAWPTNNIFCTISAPSNLPIGQVFSDWISEAVTRTVRQTDETSRIAVRSEKAAAQRPGIALRSPGHPARSRPLQERTEDDFPICRGKGRTSVIWSIRYGKQGKADLLFFVLPPVLRSSAADPALIICCIHCLYGLALYRSIDWNFIGFLFETGMCECYLRLTLR